MRVLVDNAQRFISAPPPILAQAKNIGLSKVHNARKQWLVWEKGRDIDSAKALADHDGDLADLIKDTERRWIASSDGGKR